MKKKTITVSIVVSCLILISGALYAYNSKLSEFINKKTNYYVIKVGDSYLLVPLSSEKENQKNTSNRDPYETYLQDATVIEKFLTSNKLAILDNKGRIHKLNSKKITVNYNEGKLYLLQTEVQGKYYLIPEVNLLTNNDSSVYVFSSQSHNIYTIDSKTLEVTKVTSDVIESFSKSELQLDGSTAAGLIWAHEPLFSRDATYISYLSNRRSIQQNDNRDDIWIVDTTSGKEILAVENAQSIVWGESSLYYYDTNNSSLNNYNYENDKTEEVFNNVELFQYLGSELIAFTYYDDPTVFIYNINTKDITKLATEETGVITFNFKLSPNEKLLLGTLFLDKLDAASRKFYTFNLKDHELNIIDIPGDNPLQTTIQGWINNEQFIATIHSKDGFSSFTSIFNINIENGIRDLSAACRNPC